MRPLIDWVWLAAFMMALGGVLAATDRRYRMQGARATADAPVLGSKAQAT
jgi:cytochrome c-type biogenesis protein CcmF